MKRVEAAELVEAMDRLFARLLDLKDVAAMNAYGEYANLIIDIRNGVEHPQQTLRKFAARERLINALDDDEPTVPLAGNRS